VDALKTFEFDVEGVASVERGLAGEAFGGRNDVAFFVAEDGRGRGYGDGGEVSVELLQLGIRAGEAEPFFLLLAGEDGKMPDDNPSVVAFAVLEPDLGIDAEDIAEGVLFPPSCPLM